MGSGPPSPCPCLTLAATALQPRPCQLQGQGSVGALVGTCQPQLQSPAALLKVIQLRAEVEGTLWGEEAEPPCHGVPPHPHPQHQIQLTLRSWARSLSTSSGRSGCTTVNAGTPGWGGGGAQGHGEHTPKAQQQRENQVSLP